MALRTLGTNANNSLSALLWARGGAGLLAADLATFRANVKDDLVNTHPIWPGALELNEIYIPRRGVLKVLAGDFVAYDSRGWPILLSADTIASGPWSHS